MAERFTIFGADGFIGQALVQHLQQQGHDVLPVTRENWPAQGHELGHVIYAAGMAANYRTNLQATLETQTRLPARLIEAYDFTSFLYLSSTRLYQNAASTREETALTVNPAQAADIYNLSKATAECYLLAHDAPTIRVARLSNVFGRFTRPNSFLAQILFAAAKDGFVGFQSASASSKDYVALDEVVAGLVSIACAGQKRLYNLARGANTTHGEIAAALQNLDVQVEFASDAPAQSFQQIDVARLNAEFPCPKTDLIDALPKLLTHAKSQMVK